MKVLVWIDHGQIDVIELVDNRLKDLKELVANAAWYLEDQLLNDLNQCIAFAEIERWVLQYVAGDEQFQRFKIVDVQ